MKYIVIEIQKFDTGAVSTPAWAYDNINSAWSKYHAVLSAAALSQLPVHSAILVNESGFPIEHKAFEHTQPEPEPEPAQE